MIENLGKPKFSCFRFRFIIGFKTETEKTFFFDFQSLEPIVKILADVKPAIIFELSADTAIKENF
jgi:hypothetical protein